MAEHTPGHDNEGKSESTAYETRDIKIRPLAVFAAGIIVLIVFSFLVVLWVFRLFSAQHTTQDAQSATTSRARPAVAAPADEQLRWPEPRVQSRPADDLKALRVEEDASLTTYGWVDRAGGVVHVPIDVAMRLVLKEGLPARPLETGVPTTNSRATGSGVGPLFGTPATNTDPTPFPGRLRGPARRVLPAPVIAPKGAEKK